MTQQHGRARPGFWTNCPEVAGLGQGPNKRFMGMYIHMKRLRERTDPENGVKLLRITFHTKRIFV